MDYSVDCHQLIVRIRSHLKELNARLQQSQSAGGAGEETAEGGVAGGGAAAAAAMQSKIDGATAHMISDIQFRTDLHFDEPESGVTMYALNNGKITLFWNAIDMARKKKFVREYVDCEHKDLSAEWRQEIFDKLHEKLQSGHLDSRVCWNGYFIESIDGFVVEVIAEEGEGKKKKAPALRAEFVRKKIIKKKSSKPKKEERGTIHNLRMHIARKKMGVRVGEFGEVDE